MLCRNNGGCFTFREKGNGGCIFLTINFGWLPELSVFIDSSRNAEIAVNSTEEFAKSIRRSIPCIISFKCENNTTASLTFDTRFIHFATYHPTCIATTLVLEYLNCKDAVLSFCDEYTEELELIK